MRTNQQLGYIVYGGAGPLSGDPDHRYLFFIIQSGTHPADILETRANAFIETYIEKFQELPEDEFETFRTAAIEKLKRDKDFMIEAVTHIGYICKDIPDVAAVIPEPNHFLEMRSIKHTVKQALKVCT